jgi:hypothetical protein
VDGRIEVMLGMGTILAVAVVVVDREIRFLMVAG